MKKALLLGLSTLMAFLGFMSTLNLGVKKRVVQIG